MKQALKNLPIVLAGNLLMQLGIVLFILPSGLVTGGTTGIALALHHFFGLPISIFVAVFNVAMFLLGWALLGKTFAMTTLVSTFAAPVMLETLQRIVGDFVLTEDLLLCTLFAGLCIGTSIAMIVKLGASTGGMDIPPLLLQKFMGIPVSARLYVFDFIILLGQAAFTDTHHLLYGVLLIAVYSLVLDKVMALGDQRYQLEIISKTHEEIRQAIHISAMDDFLPSLPMGLDTVIGEGAAGLSEGQAQRLSIARAILSQAPILLLDEATSALDADTEVLVLNRLRSTGKTCIAVTHRPAAIAISDWKLEVINGKCTLSQIQ